MGQPVRRVLSPVAIARYEEAIIYLGMAVAGILERPTRVLGRAAL